MPEVKLEASIQDSLPNNLIFVTGFPNSFIPEVHDYFMQLTENEIREVAEGDILWKMGSPDPGLYQYEKVEVVKVEELANGEKIIHVQGGEMKTLSRGGCWASARMRYTPGENVPSFYKLKDDSSGLQGLIHEHGSRMYDLDVAGVPVTSRPPRIRLLNNHNR